MQPELILQAVPYPLFWQTLDGVYQGCNLSFARYVGLPDPQQIAGKTDATLASESFWLPGSPALLTTLRHRVGQSRQTEAQETWSDPTPDGQDLRLRIQLSPLVDDQGEITGVLGTFQDVTSLMTHALELLQREQARQAAEALYRDIHDNAIEGMFQATPEGYLISVNPSLADLFGFDSPADLLSTGIEMHSFFPDSPQHQRFLTQITEQDRLETQIQRTDGTTLWVMERVRAVRDAQGNLLYFQGFVEDISSRKQAEIKAQESRAALSRSESLFRGMFNQAPIGIELGSPDIGGQTLALNPALLAILGYSETEQNQVNYRQYTHPEDLDRDDQLYAELMAGERSFYSMEKRCFRRDGSLIWLRIHVSLLYDSTGKQQNSLGFFEDITKRKQAEQALSNQQTFLRRLIDTCPDLIVVRDPDHHVLLANQTYANFYGQSAADLVEADELTVLPERVRQQVISENEQVLMTGSELQAQDAPQPNSQGQDRWLRWIKRAIPHPSGLGQCVLQVGTDVTELKQAALIQEQAREAAEAANRAKSTFLASMSHELRTPLNGILGYAQILMRDPHLQPNQHEGLQVIYQSGHHLLTLINDVLDLSKIEAQKLDFVPREIPLKPFLKEVINLCRIRADNKGIELNYEPIEPLPAIVQVDEKRLRQILLNLLGNAVKFTDRGRVVLTFQALELPKTELPKTELPNSKPEDHPTPTQISRPDPALNQGSQTYQYLNLQFRVEDTGVGIPADQLERIFSPFEQVGDANKRAEGTGLGLTITQRLVTQMGGSLKVNSRVGIGSTFQVELPIPCCWQDHSLVAPTSGGMITAYAGPRRYILVIDDRKDNCMVLAGMLRPLGFEVIQGSNGLQGLELAQQHQPDAIISDLVMPVLDGFEMIRRLRAIPVFQKTLIIASSASVFEFDREKSRQAGYDDFLSKPVQQEELLDKLAQGLTLTWIRSDPDPSGMVGPTPDSQPMVFPPSDELKVLYHAARIGHIGGIRQEAQRLQAMDPKYGSFVQRVLSLADQIEDEAIVELIQPHLDSV